MAYYTPEQVAKAKEWDLLTCLQVFEPGELKKCGDKRILHPYPRFPENLQREVELAQPGDRRAHRPGISYQDPGAGLFRGDERPLRPRLPRRSQNSPFQRRKPVFILPAACRVPSRAVAYLQSRGIDPDVIGACIQARILYESCKYHNCVFVGRAQSRQSPIRVPAGDVWEILNRKQPEARKPFLFSCRQRTRRATAWRWRKGAIDALSLASLVKMGGDSWQDCHYLSLGGTAPAALLQFLRDHPCVTEISLCLDNDKAGLEGIDRLTAAIRKEPELSGRIALIYPNPAAKRVREGLQPVLDRTDEAAESPARETGPA